MLSISIGEIQRNSSIFSNLTQSVQIVDKRRKKVVAVVYPVQNSSIVDKLAGKYRDRVKLIDSDLGNIKTKAMQIAMEEKYGLSS